MLERAITLGCGDQANTAAEAVLQCWERIFNVFAPLIGNSSVRMIFSRSLDLNQQAYPWLRRVAGLAVLTREQRELRATLLVLGASLATRGEQDIRSASLALMMTFADILDALIGERLTSHFLRDAFNHRISEDTQ